MQFLIFITIRLLTLSIWNRGGGEFPLTISEHIDIYREDDFEWDLIHNRLC